MGIKTLLIPVVFGWGQTSLSKPKLTLSHQVLSGQLLQCSCQHFGLPGVPSPSPALDGSMVSLLLADCRWLPEKVLWLHTAGTLLEPAVQFQLGQALPLSFPFIYPLFIPWIILHNFPGLVFFFFSFFKTSVSSYLSPLIWSTYLFMFIHLSSLWRRYILLSKIVWCFQQMSAVPWLSSLYASEGACLTLLFPPFPFHFSCPLLISPFPKLGLLSFCFECCLNHL